MEPMKNELNLQQSILKEQKENYETKINEAHVKISKMETTIALLE